MEYSAEKTGIKKNSVSHVFKKAWNCDKTDIATCYGHLERNTRGKLKDIHAIDDAKHIAKALSMFEALKDANTKTTKKSMLDIINKYK